MIENLAAKHPDLLRQLKEDGGEIIARHPEFGPVCLSYSAEHDCLTAYFPEIKRTSRLTGAIFAQYSQDILFGEKEIDPEAAMKEERYQFLFQQFLDEHQGQHPTLAETLELIKKCSK